MTSDFRGARQFSEPSGILQACRETSRSWGFLGTLNELMLRSEEATRLLSTPNAQRPTPNTSNRTASIETLGVERSALSVVGL